MHKAVKKVRLITINLSTKVVSYTTLVILQQQIVPAVFPCENKDLGAWLLLVRSKHLRSKVDTKC